MAMVSVRMGDELAKKLKEKAGSRAVGEVIRGLIEAWAGETDVIQAVSYTHPDVIHIVGQPEVPKIRGMVRASELPARLGRCSYHGCGKPGVRAFGDGWRCGEH